MDRIAYEKPRILGKPAQMMTWVRCPKCHEKAYFSYRCAMDGEEIVCHGCGAVVQAERRSE